jgi:hypothetical protein
MLSRELSRIAAEESKIKLTMKESQSQQVIKKQKTNSMKAAMKESLSQQVLKKQEMNAVKE